MAYGPDITSGETFSASGYVVDNAPAQAFDDNTDLDWAVASPSDGSTWIQVQFASAAQVEKMTARSSDWWLLNTAPLRLVLKGSNTGAFGGEETEVYDTGSFTWSSYGETKSWTFANASTFTYYRIFPYRNSTSNLVICEIEMMEVAEPAEVEADNSDAAGVSDAVDGFNCTDTLADQIGVSDLVDGTKETEPSVIS